MLVVDGDPWSLLLPLRLRRLNVGYRCNRRRRQKIDIGLPDAAKFRMRATRVLVSGKMEVIEWQSGRP